MTARDSYQPPYAELKAYSAPEITGEFELETRAGSPLGFPEDLDTTGSE